MSNMSMVQCQTSKGRAPCVMLCRYVLMQHATFHGRQSELQCSLFLHAHIAPRNTQMWSLSRGLAADRVCVSAKPQQMLNPELRGHAGLEGKGRRRRHIGGAAAFLRLREGHVHARPGVLRQERRAGVAGQGRRDEARLGRFQGASCHDEKGATCHREASLSRLCISTAHLSSRAGPSKLSVSICSRSCASGQT